LKKTSRR